MNRILLAVAIVLSNLSLANACLFCEALANTISDNIDEATVSVIAMPADRVPAAPVGRGMQETKFKVTKVLKGTWKIDDSITAFTLPDEPPTGPVLLMAFGEPEDISWLAPLPLGDSALKYLSGLESAPESGSDRLAYFLPYLVVSDRHVADDAYNEFARAPYSDIVGLGDRLKRDWVLEHLNRLLVDKSAVPRQTRLMWTLLSVCGQPEDTLLFEKLAANEGIDLDAVGFDAALGCYQSLGGTEALERVKSVYIMSKDRDVALSAVNAIRFHAVETKKFPSNQLAAALHPLLDDPSMAAQVIPDLARMEDWSIAQRLVELYRRDDAKDVRPHIINYLRVCPLDDVKKWVAECREIDPDAVRRSETIFGSIK